MTNKKFYGNLWGIVLIVLFLYVLVKYLLNDVSVHNPSIENVNKTMLEYIWSKLT